MVVSFSIYYVATVSMNSSKAKIRDAFGKNCIVRYFERGHFELDSMTSLPKNMPSGFFSAFLTNGNSYVNQKLIQRNKSFMIRNDYCRHSIRVKTENSSGQYLTLKFYLGRLAIVK